MKEGCLERSRAYNYAEPVIAAALEEHPSIQVVIDLHRDGVNGSKRLVTEINGKPTAQIMFFNGLSRTKESGELTSLPNPYQAENLAFSFQMEYEAKQYYPGFFALYLFKRLPLQPPSPPEICSSRGWCADEYGRGGEKCNGAVCGYPA